MKATKKDVYYKGGEHNCTSLDLVEKLICDLKLSDVHVVKGIFPDVALFLSRHLTGKSSILQSNSCLIFSDFYKNSMST